MKYFCFSFLLIFSCIVDKKYGRKKFSLERNNSEKHKIIPEKRIFSKGRAREFNKRIYHNNLLIEKLLTLASRARKFNVITKSFYKKIISQKNFLNNKSLWTILIKKMKKAKVLSPVENNFLHKFFLQSN